MRGFWVFAEPACSDEANFMWVLGVPSVVYEVSAAQLHEVSVDAVVSGLAEDVERCDFNVARDAALASGVVNGSETAFNVVRDALLTVSGEFYVVKAGEAVRITRLFLLLGNLAVQLTGD